MAPRNRFGPVGVLIPYGLEYVAVVAHRRFQMRRKAGVKRRVFAEADVPDPQSLDEAALIGGGKIAGMGRIPDHAVEAIVHLVHRLAVEPRGPLFEGLHVVANAGKVGIVASDRRKPRHASLQDVEAFEERAQVPHLERCDPRAAPPASYRQPFGPQLDQRFAHGRARQAIALRYHALVQILSGCEVKPKNAAAQIVIDPLAACALMCPADCHHRTPLQYRCFTYAYLTYTIILTQREGQI